MAYPVRFPCPNSSSVSDRHISKSRFPCRCINTRHRVIPYIPGPFPSNHAATFEVRFTGPPKAALPLPIAPPSLRHTDGRSASSPLRRHAFSMGRLSSEGDKFLATRPTPWCHPGSRAGIHTPLLRYLTKALSQSPTPGVWVPGLRCASPGMTAEEAAMAKMVSKAG